MKNETEKGESGTWERGVERERERETKEVNSLTCGLLQSVSSLAV